MSHWLDEADQLANRVPDDVAGNWQSFSSTNVGVWRVAIGVERGESGGSVRELAGAVNEQNLVSRSRKAQFLADVGRGLAGNHGHKPKQWTGLVVPKKPVRSTFATALLSGRLSPTF